MAVSSSSRSERPSARGRWRTGALVACGFVAAPVAQAQEAAVPVTVTALFMADPEVTAAEATSVEIGVRRGLTETAGVRFVHPVDILSPAVVPEEIEAGVGELDGIAEAVRSGETRGLDRRLDELLRVFEANLPAVKRGQLVDAYMLRALVECRRDRDRACRSGLERVVTFREDLEYDTTRYPRELEEVFTSTRDALVADGVRGSIEVATDPVGAEVFIDGRSVGAAPTVIEGLLVGDHYVTVRRTGYERAEVRLPVRADYQETHRLELVRSERTLFLEQELPRIREELGEPRAGRYTAGLTAYVYVNQVVLGELARAPDGAVDVSLYVYDLRTQFLLAERSLRAPFDEALAEQVRGLTAVLYEGVDLSGTVAPPEARLARRPSVPIYKRWWFWTAIGVVAASTVVALSVTGGGPEVPEGWVRVGGIVE